MSVQGSPSVTPVFTLALCTWKKGPKSEGPFKRCGKAAYPRPTGPWPR